MRFNVTDPCRELGGKKAKKRQGPLPWNLQPNLSKFRRTYVSRRNAPHRALTSRPVQPCVRRYLLSKGIKPATDLLWLSPPGAHILPRPDKFYTVYRGDGTPFACFVDVAEAMCFRECFCVYDKDMEARVE